MTERDDEPTADERTTRREPRPAHTPDVTSDPANEVEDGHDWSAEGGATESGPATHASRED